MKCYDDDWWVGKNSTGDVCGLFQYTLLEQHRQSDENNIQNLRIASDLARIPPGYLGSKIPERYRYTLLLSKTQMTLKNLWSNILSYQEYSWNKLQLVSFAS
jgi:hypothetical protein